MEETGYGRNIRTYHTNSMMETPPPVNLQALLKSHCETSIKDFINFWRRVELPGFYCNYAA